MLSFLYFVGLMLIGVAVGESTRDWNGVMIVGIGTMLYAVAVGCVKYLCVKYLDKK
jgi:hypothetical protein